MNCYGRNDVKNGCVRYALYDMENQVQLSMDNPVVVSSNLQPKLQFLLIDGDIYYNHWDEEAEAFETVNHPLTSHTVSPGMYQPEYISATSTEQIVLNQDFQAFTQEAQYGTSIQMISNSRFRFIPGTYQITLTAGIDFLQANGNLHAQVMNHATHIPLKTPALRVQIEVSPSVNSDDVGQATSTFIHTFGTQTDICIRPTLLAHMNANSNIYFTFIAQRI